MNRTYIFASILLGIFLLPVIFIIWDDNIDPPFISNSVYDFLVLKVIPVIAGVVSIVFFVVCYKKYNSCNHYKQTIKSRFAEHGELRTIMCFIFAPIFVYLWIFAGIGIPIKLWAFYSVNDYWSHEYQLVKVKNCGSDYEYECTRLTLLDLKTHKKNSVRWYSDKSELMKQENKKITVIGEKGAFGYIINGLEW